MKTLRVMTTALAVGAVLAATPTFAFDHHEQNNNSGMMQNGMQGGMMQGGGSMDPMAGMSDADRYKARWVFYNLDDREMKRYKSQGFDDATIKGAANIALRTGLELPYVLRQIQVSGQPFAQVAMMHGLSSTVVTEDIPGMGASGFMTGGSMSGGMMGGDRSMDRNMDRSGNTSGTSNSGSNSGSQDNNTPATPDSNSGGNGQ